MSNQPADNLNDNFMLTLLIFGVVCQLVVLLIVSRINHQIKAMRTVYWQIVAFNFIYITTITFVLFFRFNSTTKLDDLYGTFNWQYTFY